ALRAQARLQAEQDATLPARDAGPTGSSPAAVVHELFAPEVIGALPAPDPGDVFLDFEGDPLWTESGGTDWGLEYLIGLVEAPATPGAAPVFRAFWAHDRAQERQALLDVLGYLARRRAQHPGMHVYHYAPYEKTALLGLAGRHGVGEEAVDDLLRDGVLVDLYATVRTSLRTGQRSYSIKKLEPLYMPARTGAVTTAGDSIVEYAEACALRDEGRTSAWEQRLQQIADYNTDDCVSTLLLRDWLLEEAARHGVHPAPRPTTLDEELADGGPAPEEDPLVPALLEAAAGLEPRDRKAVAMVAAALGYHWRERKPFWWGHFDRLASPPEEWTDPRGTLLVEQASVVEAWHRRTPRQLPRRHLRLVGRLEPGSELRPGAAAFALYEAPLPAGAKTSSTGTRGWTERITVLDVRTEAGPDGPRDVLLVEDALRREEEPHDHLPMALCPGRPPATTSIEAALRTLGERTLAHLSAADGPPLPGHPALDLLRRVPPRTASPLPRPEDSGYVDAILAALRDLDHSYLAVQGPPGTGKTYTGARVIARLVAEGWRIGVVAQSHAVVENLLRGVAEAGVPEHRIGKRPAGADPAPAPWTWLTTPGRFTAFHDQEGGSVLGGTAWDLTNPGRLPATPLDLLVVDEAGQFSLAGTLAVAESARSLLLLGDPQQLPQVSQGRHPEPVDRSALGWLTEGHDTLPPELGYFLDRTWRMHPALCAAVSRLAYEGRLGSEPRTAQRSLEGVEPGVRTELVPHQGNAIASPEEAQAVVRLTRDLVGRRWQDPAADVDRPLEPSDVIVVAAYNAQVWTVRQALDAAGLGEVRVGTVDRFQGQQAPVVLLTTAASSADDVPRGMEFLLDRNRINVAISRGQWCAVLVRSPALTDHLPGRPDLLEELGAFLALDQPDRTDLEPWRLRAAPRP
uniref:TM0106 family RecB-like putative nuclease n=1 Tax=Actinotalea sp. C106 TaxID=2908644 RepID=UPI002028C6AD